MFTCKVALLAHDLRTPMTAITQGLRVLKSLTNSSPVASDIISHMSSCNSMCSEFLASSLHNLEILFAQGAHVPKLLVQNVVDKIIAVTSVLKDSGCVATGVTFVSQKHDAVPDVMEIDSCVSRMVVRDLYTSYL